VPLLEGDPVRLAQLLDNLVSNAIKFTPEGGRVDVRSGIERGEAVLEVRDSGIGISASDQAQLFGRFFRASNATAQGIPGTGLGLAISKAIVDAHGGEIGVTSEENVGTTFRARIPIREASGGSLETLALWPWAPRQRPLRRAYARRGENSRW
jgi:signal transduction histidine kinase